ncbi:MAG TPA: hypothetical protein VIK03_02480 [Thermoleophilia bacterium]
MDDLVPVDPAAADAATQEWLRELCRRADEILWSSYRFAMEVPGATWPRVMFPRKGQVRRVSEQEARFAFVAALLAESGSEPWAFAAEVPTRLSYRFAHRGAGEKAQKALTDLALYRHGHDEPALAVEFKSGGRSGKSEIDESIRKDVAKILAEQPDALWFHVVRSANSATLQGLLRTIDEAISRLSSPIRLSDYLAAGKMVEPRAKKIAVHVCVLNPEMTASIHRVLDYVPGKPEPDFFTIDVVATRDSLELAEGTGWDVFRGSPPAHV